MNNLKALGVSFGGSALFAVPNQHCLAVRDSNYGCLTLIPAVNESGRHVLLVNDYGFNEKARAALDKTLAKLAERAGTGKSGDVVLSEVWTPVVRVSKAILDVEAALKESGFVTDKLGVQTIAQLPVEEACALDMPLADRAAWPEVLVRGLNNQNTAVIMGLSLCCKNARHESFDIYKTLRSKDAFGYPLPCVVSRVMLEGAPENVHAMALATLKNKFGENLLRCTVTPCEGGHVLEYATMISSDAVKALMERTYPVFEQNQSHDCIRVLEFKLTQPLTVEEQAELRGAIEGSAVAVTCEFRERSVRVGFPAYSKIPVEQSEDLRRRAEFVGQFTGDIMQALEAVETLAFNKQGPVQFKSESSYKKMPLVNRADFTHGRITTTRKVHVPLSQSFLGAAETNEWYVESPVPGHVLALTEKDGEVKGGYLVRKGVAERPEEARAEVDKLLSLVA